jgi:hypothetical protein
MRFRYALTPRVSRPRLTVGRLRGSPSQVQDIEPFAAQMRHHFGLDVLIREPSRVRQPHACCSASEMTRSCLSTSLRLGEHYRCLSPIRTRENARRSRRLPDPADSNPRFGLERAAATPTATRTYVEVATRGCHHSLARNGRGGRRGRVLLLVVTPLIPAGTILVDPATGAPPLATCIALSTQACPIGRRAKRAR